MVTTLISLRARQFIRLIKTVGLPLSLVALLVFSGFGFQLLGTILSLPAWWAAPLMALILGYIHFARRDLTFLESIASRSKLLAALGLEYLLLAAPVVMFQLVQHKFLIALGLVIVSIVVAALPSPSGTASLKSRPLSFSFIPIELYEVRIILERYWLPFFIIWALMFLGYFHIAFFLLALLFLLTIILSGFVFNEPLEIISAKGNFLHEKVGINIGFCSLLFLPQLALTYYFHPTDLWVLLYGYVFFVVILGLAICYKYAHYDPLRSRTLNANFIAIIMVLSLLPGFILIAIGSFIYYYFRAQQRLAYYL